MNKKKLKKRAGDFGITIPVFGIGIIFSFGQSNEKIMAVLKDAGIKYMPNLLSESDPARGCTYCDGSVTALIVMKEWPERASHYNTLNHEIFHACDMTLRNTGFNLSNDSQEAWAYMIGHVSERIYQILWIKKHAK